MEGKIAYCHSSNQVFPVCRQVHFFGFDRVGQRSKRIAREVRESDLPVERCREGKFDLFFVACINWRCTCTHSDWPVHLQEMADMLQTVLLKVDSFRICRSAGHA